MTSEEEGSSQGTIALQTVGCKLNQAETDSLAREFLKAGYQVVPPHYAADIYVLNTCTVTHIADRKCRKLLRLAQRRNPHTLVVATGCYAQRAPEELARIEGLGAVVDNRDKERLVAIVRENFIKHEESGIHDTIRSALNRTRPLVRIQEGCSHPCSFCIVPRVRGPERSRPRPEIITEIKERVAEGHKEVVLTGTRIGSYGHDGGLKDLVKEVLDVTGVPRLRLSSLEPSDLTPDLLSLWKDKRLCPHIHLPLQSGSDSVLERMGRAYNTSEYLQAVSLAQEAIPDLALTTDIMVGFPRESEEAFNESHRLCENIGFARTHVFTYSARPGTKAVRIGDTIDDDTKKRRSRSMLELARRSSWRFQKGFLGRTMTVLWEGTREGIWYGLTDNYIRVFLPATEFLGTKLLPVKLVSRTEKGIWGELVLQKTTS